MHEATTGASASSRERGFILLAVLLVSLLLIASASAFTYMVRSQIRLASATARAAEAEALADAGINLAMIDLAIARQSPFEWTRRFAIGGEPTTCRVPNGAGLITIAVEDEAGKINLNSRNEQLLLAFLLGIGVEKGAAAPLLERLIDYRDSDTLSRDGSAENAITSGVSSPAFKNRPFDVIEEVAQVPGFSQTLYDAARAHVTVYSDIDGFDPAQSSPLLREIIARGASDPMIQGFGTASPVFSSNGIPSSFIGPSTRRALSIVATGTATSGARFTRHVVVKQSPAANGDYVIRRWTIGPRALSAETAEELPPC